MQRRPPFPDVTLALIAGGRGTRLGGATKCLLLYEGETFLDRQLRFRPLFAETLMVTSVPEEGTARGVPCVQDVVEDRGAPGGVQAALHHASTPWVLALAADMPFVSQAVLELLLGQRGPALDAVMFEVGGRAEPLLACYRSDLAPRWRLALAEAPSFARLLAPFRVRTLGEKDLQAVDPELRAVVSINVPGDLARYGIRFRDVAPPMR